MTCPTTTAKENMDMKIKNSGLSEITSIRRYLKKGAHEDLPKMTCPRCLDHMVVCLTTTNYFGAVPSIQNVMAIGLCGLSNPKRE